MAVGTHSSPGRRARRLGGASHTREMSANDPQAAAAPDERDARALTIVRRLAAAGGMLLIVAAIGWLAWSWYASRVPGTYNVMDYGVADYGGGRIPAHAAEHAHGAVGAADVSRLAGPRTGSPDATFTLTAQRARLELASGRTAEALTFGGRVPGPELRMRQGDLVAVTLVNRDVEQGVSVHFHGLDVPNAEDGVSGVTQDAVMPGERHTYRFRVHQVGTFWYHTHQRSAKDVRRGLYGAFVIEPARPAGDALDMTVMAHELGGRPAFNDREGASARAVGEGTPVRLRLINANSTPRRLRLSGTPFRVVAIDGMDVNRPQPVRGAALELGGGARYDVAFTMPRRPVALAIANTRTVLVLGRDRRWRERPPVSERVLDPATYGQPTRSAFDASSRFDREFSLEIGKRPGFVDGRPGHHWSLNGKLFPDTPVFVVEKGDLVRVSVENDTGTVHPMHLHGHHVRVLSRDGVAVRGSPWWVDTLNVKPGERYDVAFRASNTGVWMFHCHNLRHAAEGMTMHLAYAGVRTPFPVGGDAHNHPE